MLCYYLNVHIQGQRVKIVQQGTRRCWELELCASCLLLGASPWLHVISDFLKGFLFCQSYPQCCWYFPFLFLTYSQHLPRCGAMIGRRSWQHTEESSERSSREQPTELVLLLQLETTMSVFSVWIIWIAAHSLYCNATGLCCYAGRIVVHFPAEARDCIPPHPLSSKSFRPGFSLGDEALGREADHWTSYGANLWTCGAVSPLLRIPS